MENSLPYLKFILGVFSTRIHDKKSFAVSTLAAKKRKKVIRVGRGRMGGGHVFTDSD